MSDKCGNCDCADKSQCVNYYCEGGSNPSSSKGGSAKSVFCSKNGCIKKGNSYVIETDKSYIETVVMGVPADENDGKCKCGPSCSCTNCTCGH